MNNQLSIGVNISGVIIDVDNDILVVVLTAIKPKHSNSILTDAITLQYKMKLLPPVFVSAIDDVKNNALTVAMDSNHIPKQFPNALLPPKLKTEQVISIHSIAIANYNYLSKYNTSIVMNNAVQEFNKINIDYDLALTDDLSYNKNSWDGMCITYKLHHGIFGKQYKSSGTYLEMAFVQKMFDVIDNELDKLLK